MTDSCPNCCRRGIQPRAERTTAGQLHSAYRCPHCGHTWTTSRQTNAYQPAA